MKNEEKTQYIDDISSAVISGVKSLLDKKLAPYNKLTCQVNDHDDRIEWMERILLKNKVGKWAISWTIIIVFIVFLLLAYILTL